MGHLQVRGQLIADARVAAFALDGSAFTVAATAARQHYGKKKPGQGKNGLAVRDDSSSSSFFFSTYEYRD